MTFPLLFTIYLVLVAAGAAAVALRCLTGRARLATVALLGIWLAYASLLGITGIIARYHQLPPGIVLLILPIILTLLILTLGRPGAVLAHQIPLWLLLGFQLFRVGVELSLHHLWSLGLAPRIVTLEGGNIEILVALTAPAAARLVSLGPLGRRIAWGWNLAGLLSLGNVAFRAVLSAPGPLHFIHVEVPDIAILTYPFTFIPGFMAPLALALHILAFRAFSINGNAAAKPN